MPVEYHDLGEAFRKGWALSLPLYQPYDCAIDLLPGATLPSGQLFNLSHLEREAMEKYINDYLTAGITHPSSYSLGTGFFFMAKKDKSLHPCLNSITVKNKYPLPLLSSAFKPLHRASIWL